MTMRPKDKRSLSKLRKPTFDNDGNTKRYNLLIKNFAFRLLKPPERRHTKTRKKLNTADKTRNFTRHGKAQSDLSKDLRAFVPLFGWSAKYGSERSRQTTKRFFGRFTCNVNTQGRKRKSATDQKPGTNCRNCEGHALQSYQ